jgi:hypothetical protein
MSENVNEAPVEVPQQVQPTDTAVNGGTTVTGTVQPESFGGDVKDATVQAKDVLTGAGIAVQDVEKIVSTLSQNGLTIATAEQVAGDVSDIAAEVKADPAVVEHAKSALSDFGHAAQDVEEFFAHLFHRGFTVVHTGQGKVEAPSA